MLAAKAPICQLKSVLGTSPLSLHYFLTVFGDAAFQMSYASFMVKNQSGKDETRSTGRPRRGFSGGGVTYSSCALCSLPKWRDWVLTKLISINDSLNSLFYLFQLYNGNRADPFDKS